MKRISLFLFLLVSACTLAQNVDSILSRMTLSEKIAIIHAQSKFSSSGVARLGIPGLWCTDGPHGVRPEVLWDEWTQAGWTNDSCTAFPALTCLAATWNTDMAALYGTSIGEEALYRGKNVLLGPGVNIYRTPLNGRNFEYMGEDPCLSASMVVPYVQNLQKQGVAACVKHYALNNQENGRHVVNAQVSDRALYEIYLPAFRAAVVEGGAWSIMGAYNRYQDQYACHNSILLQRILREEWGFDGCVISDWGGCLNTDEAIHNGLDLEFGTWTNGLTEGTSNAYDCYYLANPYKQKILNGEVGTEELDEKVRHVLRLILRTSMNPNRGFGSLVSDEHLAAARRIAGEGMVLLKNDKVKGQPLLPISPDVRRIVVVGENAVRMMSVGGGSSSLKVKHEVSPLEGIRARAVQTGAEVRWVRGYAGDGRVVQDGMSGADLSEVRTPEDLRREAIAAAREADLVIYVGGLNKSHNQDCEGGDRLTYDLPYGQDELIAALAKVNPRLVLVSVSGNAYAMPWLRQVPAVVQAWYSGSEAGNALADVLWGDINPSGRLPFTWAAQLTDYPAHQHGPEGYPGVDNQVRYAEDIFVGYRYADLKGSPRPLFAFGHGLSYTSFRYGKATIVPSADGWQVEIPITNTGTRSGQEVVQLYVSMPSCPLPTPVKQLRAFHKVMLQPGEIQSVSFTITPDMLSYFDPDQHQWIQASDHFEVLIGPSSGDIRAHVSP